MFDGCPSDEALNEASRKIAPYVPPGIRTVDVHTARSLLETEPDLVLLDVRMPVELAEGRLGDGVNLDFFADDFETALTGLDRTAHYLLHCRTGGRSQFALDLMIRLGFKNIAHMPAGYDGWVREGLPVLGDMATA